MGSSASLLGRMKMPDTTGRGRQWGRGGGGARLEQLLDIRGPHVAFCLFVEFSRSILIPKYVSFWHLLEPDGYYRRFNVAIYSA